MGAKRIMPDEVRKAREMRARGDTWASIGKVLGRSGTGIRNAVLEAPDEFDEADYDSDRPGEVIVNLYGKELRRFTVTARDAVEAIEMLEPK